MNSANPTRSNNNEFPSRNRWLKSINGRAILCLLLGLCVVLSTSSALHANQVSKACGKKWAARAMKLSQEQLAWMLEQRVAEVTADLDQDGKPDTLTLTSYPNFRKCDVKTMWSQKENNVRIEYANGKIQTFHWFGETITQKLLIYPSTGRILVVGFNPEGQQAAKWLKYRTVPPTLKASHTLVAEYKKPGDEALDGVFQIASIPYLDSP